LLAFAAGLRLRQRALPRAQATNGGNGGNGTMYYGSYDKKVLVIDEATLTVRDSMPLSIGIPIGLTLSASRKTLYAIEPSYSTWRFSTSPHARQQERSR
jgi:hypothetical protein